MTAATDLAVENLADLGTFLDGCADIVAEWDVTDLLRLRATLDDTLTQLKGAIGAVELRMLAVMQPGETVQEPGAGAATLGYSGKKACRGAMLARRVAALVADTEYTDPETGEVGAPVPPAVVAERTADELVTVFGLDTASTSFRGKEAEKRNLRPADFYDYTDGTPVVRWTR